MMRRLIMLLHAACKSACNHGLGPDWPVSWLYHLSSWYQPSSLECVLASHACSATHTQLRQEACTSMRASLSL
jgi:hypothetical protein